MMESLLLPVLYLSGCCQYGIAYYLHAQQSLKLKKLLPGLLLSFVAMSLGLFHAAPDIVLRTVIAILLAICLFRSIPCSIMRRIPVLLVLIFSLESLSTLIALLLYGFPKGPITTAKILLCDVFSLLALGAYSCVKQYLDHHSEKKLFLKKLLPFLLVINAIILLTSIEVIIYLAPKSGTGVFLRITYVMAVLGLLAVMGTIWTAVLLFHINGRVSQAAAVWEKYAGSVKQHYSDLLNGRRTPDDSAMN